MLTAALDYDLPPDLIAQEPPPERGAARMMVLERATGRRSHGGIRDLPHWLRPGDLLVLNNTRVFPARLLGAWNDTGGGVELLLLEPAAVAEAGAASSGIAAFEENWVCLCGSGRRARPGPRASTAARRLEAELVAVAGAGRVTAR
jgi:S-adenosylmethionine:tRNA ribosyltransferase-isomerase